MTFVCPDLKDESTLWGCDCASHAEARKRTLRNGTTTTGLQCLRCGLWQAKRKADFAASEFLRLPWYDENLRDRFSETQRSAAEAKRSAENAEWWELFNEYLRSLEWDEIRDKVMKRAGGVCESCLERRATQVHHASYRYVFQEPCFDLRAICAECHRRITAADRERRERERRRLAL